jgi:hypothetical protein
MDPGPVKIFTTSDVPRLRYIAGLLLGDLLGLSWEIVTDKRKLGKSPVINYSPENIKGSFRISPSSLLFETGLKSQELNVSEWRALPVFFQTDSGSDLPFDLFAASFYLVSRYEEYLDFEPDEFGRFRASLSCAYKNGFLLKPVVNLWVKEFSRTLLMKFRDLAFKRSSFSAMVTIDIDQPFEFLGKDVLRSIGGLFRDFGKGGGKAGERYRIVAKGEKDPYDVFDYILNEVKKSGCDARFFIPVGDRSAYDKQPSWQNEDYRKLIINVADRFPVGLHPSFYASLDKTKLKSELGRLKNILSADIKAARCHYIRIKFPQTYCNLDGLGFTEDYSMGYPDEPGFRAGIAAPFFFYDLTSEKKTNLRIFPFQIMDGTLSKYKKMDSSASDSIIAEIMDETKKAGGLFISIWHNTSLLDSPEWNSWREVFEKMLMRSKQ